MVRPDQHADRATQRTSHANNCEAAAAFRFIRMPWLANVKEGLVLGDLRYDREPELGFAELRHRRSTELPARSYRTGPSRGGSGSTSRAVGY